MKTQNAKKYHELSKPFENADVANKAIGDFFDELLAAAIGRDSLTSFARLRLITWNTHVWYPR